MARRCRARLPDVPVHRRRRPARRARPTSATISRPPSAACCSAPHRGSFLGHCPAGTRGLACCNYLVMNLAANCPMDCGYCFLQEYLADNAAAHGLREPGGGARRARAGARPPHRPPLPHRHGRARRQPGARSADRPQRRARAVLRGAAERAPRAQDQDRRGRRSRSRSIPKDRVVVSWSLAPPAAVRVRRARHGGDPGAARGGAARRRRRLQGRRPLRSDDRARRLGGGLSRPRRRGRRRRARRPPRLGQHGRAPLLAGPPHEGAAARFPGTPLLAGEQVPSADGKWRDFQPLRVDMYRRVRAFVEDGASRTCRSISAWRRPTCGSASSATPPPAEQALGARLAAR